MLVQIALGCFLLALGFTAWHLFLEEKQTAGRWVIYVMTLSSIAICVAYVGFCVGFWFGTNAVKY